MKQKLFTLFLILAASVGTIFAVTIKGIEYKLNGTRNTAEVTYKSRKYSGEVIIPSSVKYKNQTYSVTSIGEWAFYECIGLTSVTIPNSVTKIGWCAFYGCKGLTSPMYNAHVFAYMPTSYSGAYAIPEGIENIADYAFFSCTGLTSVTIPNSVTEIAWHAFDGCTGLKSVTILNSVTSIGSCAFQDCKGLTSPMYNAHVFAYMPTSYSGAYAIPEGIENIAGCAFSSCKGLTSVTIPNSVTEIAWHAFDGCTGLTSVTIPNSVTSIGGCAFQGCTGLKEVNYPQGLNLSDAGIPSKVRLIPYDENNKPVPVQPQASPSPAPKSTYAAAKSAVDVNIPETKAHTPNTFVVIFANENYKNVDAVPFALNDGKIFQQYCQKTLGIPHTNIHCVENASYNDIRLELAWLENVCKKYEGTASVIVYYAGHGIPDASDKSSYLLPVDGDGRYVATGYRLDDLYEKLGNMPTKSVVVLLDACFSGANKDGKMLTKERGVALKSRPGQPQGNMVVFSAAQSDETALPYNDEGHGMFTYYILKKLQETKGDITLKDLSDYVIREVGRTSAVLNKPQTPSITPAVAVTDEWKSWKLK